jgi:uncharacterized protein (DUF1810 family)
MSDLDRFRRAQDRSGDGFAAAFSEIQAGRKQGHWIWYIFPQLVGLGRSGLSHTYGISGVREAADYLRDPVLGSRLLDITTAVETQLRAGVPLETLMGSSIDALKLVSSLTLFGGVAGRVPVSGEAAGYESLAATADRVLEHAAAQGYPRCAFTQAVLAR